MTKKGKGLMDIPLLLAVLSLMAIGVVIVYSASAVKAGIDPRTGNTGNWEYYFLRQLAFSVGGAFLLLAFAAVPYTFWKSKVALLYLATVAVLVLVLFVGKDIKGAHRWIVIWGQSVQPSEFAKLAVVMYLASYLAKKGEDLRERPARVLRPLLVVAVPAGLIFLERDLGTTVFVFLLAFGLLFLGGVKGRVLVAGLVALALLAGAAIAATPYRRDRAAHFLATLAGRTPPVEARAEPTQVDQSLAAFANGGLLGRGLGQGDSKRYFLPEAHTDFILAVVGEELGAPGVLAVLGLFAVVVWRAFSIAGAAPEPFAVLLASGIALLIGMGALMNAMMVTGILPPKGIALPFVSYGGSSLLASVAGVGILLNIAGRRAAA